MKFRTLIGDKYTYSDEFGTLENYFGYVGGEDHEMQIGNIWYPIDKIERAVIIMYAKARQ